MAKTFELETLQMRLAGSEFATLDLHQRIQRALRALILEGSLSAGLKLPATRVLARSLGVARDTVENAYVQLQRDGYINRRGGAGSYVAQTRAASCMAPFAGACNNATHAVLKPPRKRPG